MKILDGHIHAMPGQAQPQQMLERMREIGIEGGAVFSPDAENPVFGTGWDYELRMDSLQAWTEGYEDRLYPILYIHPLEKDALKKAHDAVSRGVVAFKIICDCFYVSDEPCMELLREINSMGKPIMFHSGILWDGFASSQYNRPLNWECLVSVPGLRFSLAHCSYPWYDECIAMYGKFLNAYAVNPKVSAEMFMDLTPGTPAIYRQDLLHKLYHVGYDVSHNVFFGTDCTANDYNAVWSGGWVERDRRILTEEGVGQRLQGLYFGENFRRFLGLIPKDFQHVSPVPDSADVWSLEKANLE